MRRQSHPVWFVCSIYVLSSMIGLLLGILILNEIEPNSPILVDLRKFIQEQESLR
jgi:hypothetical protein